jgi:hypothetical protein
MPTCRRSEKGLGQDSEVEIITFEDHEEIEPAVPEPPRKSRTEKRKRKRKKSATEESAGRLVIRLKTTGSAPIAAAVDEEERPRSTTEILETSIHSVKDGPVARVQTK